MKWRAEAILATPLPALLLAGCGVSDSRRAAGEAEAAARKAAFIAARAVPDMPVKIGNAYEAYGDRHVPRDEPRYEATGFASWYGDELRGKPTANGETFNPDGISAAHPTLPLPSYIEVTALDTGRTIVARVNDRGPFSNDRLIDLSHGAARQLGISGDGHARVRIRRVYPDKQERLLLRAGLSAPERPRQGPGSRTPAPIHAPAPEGVPRYVQVAAFASRERALGMADRIGAHVDRAGAVYRVRFGPFDNEAAAKQALRDASAKGYPGAHILPDSVP